MSHNGFHEELITELYDASMSPDLWPSVLQSLADSVSAEVGVLFTTDFVNHTPPVLHATHDGAPLDAFVTDHMDNPWSRASLSNPAGTIARTESLVPMDVLKQTKFYADVLEPSGLLHSLGGNLINRRGVLSCFSFLRGRRDGAFRHTELAAMHRIMPHFLRAAEISMRLAVTDARQPSALDLLHHLATPLFLVDPQGKVVFSNRAAEDLLASQSDLTLRRGRLQTTDSEASAKLRQRIGLATAAASTDPGRSAEHHLAVPLSDSSIPLVLSIAPLGSHCLRVGGEQPVAIVHAGEHPLHPRISEEALMQAFFLTATEARVARLVARGCGLDVVARELGVSKNTVRTHTARVFDKTGTRRQAELARLLYSVIPRG